MPAYCLPDAHVPPPFSKAMPARGKRACPHLPERSVAYAKDGQGRVHKCVSHSAKPLAPRRHIAGYVETKRQARCRRQGESTWKAGKRSETYPRRSNDRFGFNFIKAVFYPRRLECLFGHIRPFASSHSPHVLLSEAKNAPQQADNYASKIHPNPTVDKIKTASKCVFRPAKHSLALWERAGERACRPKHTF